MRKMLVLALVLPVLVAFTACGSPTEPSTPTLFPSAGTLNLGEEMQFQVVDQDLQTINDVRCYNFEVKYFKGNFANDAEVDQVVRVQQQSVCSYKVIFDPGSIWMVPDSLSRPSSLTVGIQVPGATLRSDVALRWEN
jgi:hypothetical protein